MTSQRSLRMKTRALSAFVLFIALLTVLAALAQQAGTGQSAKPSVVAKPPDASTSAQALNPAQPGADGAVRFPMGRSQTKRHSAHPMDLIPPSFALRATYDSAGRVATSVAVGDLNGDGKPDLVVANAGSGTVDVLLGNGDGTFQAAVAYGSGGGASTVAIADVNGDGKPDIVVANGGVGVLLGNGDGTFQPVVNYGAGGDSDSVAVADVNRDGKLDIVVTNWCSDQYCDGTVVVLLGNGDGTFQPAVTYSSGGEYGESVAVADVNDDGKPDLLVANLGLDTGQIGVLLGNGDGTFQPAVSYSWSGRPDSLAVADVNGDGKLDLLMGNWAGATVGVMLGNGDGTFQAAVTYPSGGSGSVGGRLVAMADVNGDGNLDLLVTTPCGNNNCDNHGTVGVLLGNGDGTFQAAVNFDSGGYGASGIAVVDVNGDGRLDLLIANNCSSWQTCGDSSGQPDGIVGVLLNNTGAPPPSKSPTSTTISSSLNPSVYRQAITFTGSVTSTGGTPPNGETVTFYSGLGVLGTASLTAGIASLTTSSLQSGLHPISAAYLGDTYFTASPSPVLQQAVDTSSQSPTATALTSSHNPSTYGQKATFTATVTTSGSTTPTGKVNFNWGSYSIGTATLNASGVATLTRSDLNADTYPLFAVYTGDANNGPSASPILDQVVHPVTSAAALSSSPNPSASGQAVTFTATITTPTGTPTGPVTFTAGKKVLGTVELSGGKAKFTISTLPTGSTTVTATYYGDSNIAKSSASVTQTVQ